MRPLNGSRAMTREEKNARRRELDANPFHRALTYKTAKAWRDAHRDEINARRRAKYAANRESFCARQRAYNEAHPEVKKKSWKRWASKPENRAKLRERDRIRAADPVAAERKRQLRRKRMKNPKVRNHVRWQKRFYYHKHKHDATGLRWKYKFLWLPAWRKIAAAGPDRIEKYRRRCAVQTWCYFVRWYFQETGERLSAQKNTEKISGGKTRPVNTQRKTKQ